MLSNFMLVCDMIDVRKSNEVRRVTSLLVGGEYSFADISRQHVVHGAAGRDHNTCKHNANVLLFLPREHMRGRSWES